MKVSSKPFHPTDSTNGWHSGGWYTRQGSSAKCHAHEACTDHSLLQEEQVGGVEMPQGLGAGVGARYLELCLVMQSFNDYWW